MRKLSLLLVMASLCATVGLAASPSPAAISSSDGWDLLIPVAGRTDGFGGELFLTDLTLVNFGGPESQLVEVTWIPQGGTAVPFSDILTLGGYAAYNAEDVIGTLFETTGVGAIRIRSVDAMGANDTGATIDAFARIWTETTCAGSAGTVSQSVPAVVLSDWRSGSGAYVHGARSDAQFRTNYGIVNLSDAPLTFRVLANTMTGRVEETVVVPAMGTVHRPVPTGAEGDLSLFFEPIGVPEGALWSAYGSTVDNQTGSGWTMVAVQPRVDVVF